MTRIKNILNFPELIFLIISTIFGLLFMIIVPSHMVPDESSHILRACEVANGTFYNKTPSDKTIFEKKLNKFINQRKSEKFHNTSGYSPVMYISSSLGIKLGNFLFEDGNIIFYLGRMFNLFMYIFMCFLAIKITPIFKYQFMFVSLLPMSLYEGMSYSADSFNNGFAFLFFAYLFKLIFSNKELTKKDYILLTIFTSLGSFCKLNIFPLFLFPFLPIKKHKFIKVTTYILLGIIISYTWAHINNIYLNPQETVINDFSIIFKYPVEVLKEIIISTLENSDAYLKGCIGILGLYNVYLPMYIYIAIITLFISSFIILHENVKIKLQITGLLVFILFHILLLYYYLNTWTPTYSKVIVGIQGRYYIQILPYLFLTLSKNSYKYQFSERTKNIYKIILIVLLVIILIIVTKRINLIFNINK